MNSLRSAAIAIAALVVVACSGEPAPPPYTPGLGEIMAFNQMRHAKLWFAAEGGDWSLAEYELAELREGFEDASRFHPTLQDAPLPLADLVPKLTAAPLAALDAAIAARDRVRFEAAFDTLTSACNGCHAATRHEYNVVTRPTTNPFSNQSFSPPTQ